MTQPDLSRAVWRKSTHSGGNHDCVEVADLRSTIALRDSKNPSGSALIVTPGDWHALTDDLKNGAHDL